MATTVNEQAAPSAADSMTVTFKKRGAMGKKNMKKRIVAPPSESDESSDDSSSNDHPSQAFKRRKPNIDVSSSSINKKPTDQELSITNAADRKAQITYTNDATKQSNWFDEDLKDSSVASANTSGAQQSRSGPYKGPASQTSSVPKQIGPTKATNVRMTTMIDYAPDVCKDYKMTGYCGFGDSCKFLHERSDYKQGWELDRDWENVTKGKKVTQGVKKTQEDDDDDDIPQDIPFACIICEESYKEPIVTRCGHYFCEKCALQRYRRDPTCRACGSGTNGVFNSAKRLKKILDKRRKQAENGEEVIEE